MCFEGRRTCRRRSRAVWEARSSAGVDLVAGHGDASRTMGIGAGEDRYAALGRV